MSSQLSDFFMRCLIQFSILIATTSQKCAAVPRRARIEGLYTLCITHLYARE